MKPTVFYVEKEPCPELHEHILKHLPRMQYWYEWQGCELIYLPLHQLGNIKWDSIQDYLTYQFPVLNKPEFKEVLGTLQEPAHMLVNRLLVKTSLQTADGKTFLIYTDDVLAHSELPFKILASYTGEQGSVEEFFQTGFQELWNLQQPAFLSEEIQLLDPSYQDYHADIDQTPVSNNLNFQFNELSNFILPEENEAISILSPDVKAHLDGLKEIGNKTLMLDVVVHLLNNLNPYLKADKQAVLKMIERYWSEYAVTPHPSRLLIDKHSKLFLTDFGNLEIKMSPLPKTLFLFYLRHPEGIAFPYLSDHRQELEQIYSKITNSSNPENIRKSITELVDATKNSVNEKCSRVKEAFVGALNISIAKAYLIEGPRGGLKKISLDRNLVTFDIPQLQGCRD